jgi:hypothetical protein
MTIVRGAATAIFSNDPRLAALPASVAGVGGS